MDNNLAYLPLRQRLYRIIEALNRNKKKPTVVRTLREKFAAQLETADRPLRCPSAAAAAASCSHGNTPESQLFTRAVWMGQLREARLLWNTNSVCPRELTALEDLMRSSPLHRMVLLAGYKDPAATEQFLEQVIRDSKLPRLESLCFRGVTERLGDSQGSMWVKAGRTGLPNPLCESLANIHQVRIYVNAAVKEEEEEKEKEKEEEEKEKKKQHSD